MPSKPSPIKRGLVLNNIYRLESLLGKGGMGEVWKATHLLLGEPRAIKLLLASSTAYPEAQTRFILGEAKNALRLQHPYIVRVHDLGQDYDLPYIVMEYVAGASHGSDLRQWLRRAGKLNLEPCTKLLNQIGAALSYAHSQNLIHRDVKPANILITAAGDFKLADFGIVKDLQAVSDLFLTNPGLALGTPAYLAPEQANGQADARSDIYSLGVVLYEALTGALPFIRNSQSNAGWPLTANPVSPTELDSSIPQEISWVILKALEKEPSQRYATVTQFIAAYEQALQNYKAGIDDSTVEIPITSKTVTTNLPSEQVVNNLPIQVTSLLGRSQEISEISALMIAAKNRLITLTGTGGTGKTRLALAVAERILAQFKDGVYFLALDSITEGNTFISEIALTLGLTDQPNKTILEVLKPYLLPKKILLVLDNFEQLIEKGATLLAELLKSSPNLALLVTSRIPLQLSAECEYKVAPLPFPSESFEGATPQALIEYSSVALFVQRAQAVRPDFDLTEENAGTVAEICRKLNGLPLAIELAAARTRAFSPQMILERLSLKLLMSGNRDLPDRQKTLRGAIGWSYDLLTVAEQTLFARLSVFAGDFTFQEAEVVCALGDDLELDIFEGVESLVMKNLLRQKEALLPSGQMRYDMLETIREYGLEKLAERGELETVRNQYALCYARLSRELAGKLRGADSILCLKKLDIEYTNLREILYQSLCADGISDIESGLEIAAALWWYWRVRGYLNEGKYYIGQAILKLNALPSAPLQRAILLTLLGDISSKLGEFDLAYEYTQESLTLSRQLENRPNSAFALANLGWLLASQGEYEAGLDYSLQSVALFREINNLQGLGNVLLNLGWITLNQGEFAKAVEYSKESLVIFRQLEDKWGLGNGLFVLGTTTREMTQDAEGTNYLEEALVIFREIGYRYGVASLMTNLGMGALHKSNFVTAKGYFEEGLKLFREMDAKQSISNVLENLAATAIEQGDLVAALRYLRESLVLWQQLGDRRGMLYSLANFMGLQAKYLLGREINKHEQSFKYLACIAGAITQLSNAGKMPLLEQPWVSYFEHGTALAQKSLSSELYAESLAKGENLNVSEMVNYALNLELSLKD